MFLPSCSRCLQNRTQLLAQCSKAYYLSCTRTLHVKVKSKNGERNENFMARAQSSSSHWRIGSGKYSLSNLRAYSKNTHGVLDFGARGRNLLGVLPAVNGVRWKSSGSVLDSLESVDAASINDVIPDVPAIPGAELFESFVADYSSGFGKSYWPLSNWLGYGMDWVHGYTDFPWWGVIVLTTLAVRTISLPMLVMSQQNAAKMHNASPKIKEATQAATEAKERGDQIETMEAQMDIKMVYEEHDVKLGRTFIVMGFSALVFLTFYFTLRSMCKEPAVPAMKTEGARWFKDLTEPDPWILVDFPLVPYIRALAVACSASILAVVVIGAETGMSAAQWGKKFKVLIYGGIFTFMSVFGSRMPTAVLIYWVSSNAYNFLASMICRIPIVGQWLRIPQRIKFDPDLAPKSKVPPMKRVSKFFKSFGGRDKDISLEQLKARDRKDFLASGKARPVPRTYSYNPLEKQRHKMVGRKMEDLEKRMRMR